MEKKQVRSLRSSRSFMFHIYIPRTGLWVEQISRVITRVAASRGVPDRNNCLSCGLPNCNPYFLPGFGGKVERLLQRRVESDSGWLAFTAGISGFHNGPGWVGCWLSCFVLVTVTGLGAQIGVSAAALLRWEWQVSIGSGLSVTICSFSWTCSCFWTSWVDFINWFV